MQNRTRSRIYQIEFYSVKMIDQAFGLVCMGAHVFVYQLIYELRLKYKHTNLAYLITYQYI